MGRTVQQGYARKTQPETYIRRAIKDILEADGWDVTYHQQGPLCRRGFPDLTALKDGKTLYIEVKTKTGRQSDYQIAFQRACESHGGTYILARGVEDIQPYLTRLTSLF